MQEITCFYLKGCPYCKRASKYLQELQEENGAYAAVPIRMVEESEERQLASSYDYYYVPCFYRGEEKLFEGAPDKEDIKKVLDRALEG